MTIIALCCTASIPFGSNNLALTTPIEGLVTPTRSSSVRDIDFKKHFQDLKVEGSIVIYDANGDR
jgi:beta-lactamase class D